MPYRAFLALSEYGWCALGMGSWLAGGLIVPGYLWACYGWWLSAARGLQLICVCAHVWRDSGLGWV